jgi:hypothetical protein
MSWLKFNPSVPLYFEVKLGIEMMNTKVLLLLTTCLMIGGCVNVKSVRDDGVYKQYNDKGYTYYSFSNETKMVFIHSCDACDDIEAFEKLEKMMVNPELNGVRYTNKEKYISTYGETGKMHWDGKIKKSRNGGIENSIFLKKNKNRIVKIADYRTNDLYHLLSWNGVDVIGDGYDDIFLYGDRYARVKKNHKYGVYDIKKGGFVLPIEYNWIELGTADLMPLNKNGKIGFYDTKFRVKIEPQFSDVHKSNFSGKAYFVDGVQAVKESNTKWIFIDKAGRRISKLEVDQVGDYLSRKFVPVITGTSNIYEYVDLVSMRQHKLRSYGSMAVDGYLTHYLGGSEYIVTDANGMPALKKTFDQIFPVGLVNGKTVFVVKKDGKAGVINLAGNELVPLKFNVIELVVGDDGKTIAFKAGIGRSITDRKKGVFDPDGKLIIPVEFGQIERVGGDHYIARKTASGYKRISAALYKSDTLNPVFEADDIISFKTSKLLSFVKEGMYGIVDLNGKVVVEQKYHYIDEIKGSLFVEDFGGGESSINNFQGETIKTSDRRFKFYNKYYYDPDESETYDYDFKKLINTGGGALSTCGDENFIVTNGNEKTFYKYDGSVVVKGYANITCYFNGRLQKYILVKDEMK